MALDQTKVGQHITAQMEALEADYGDDCEIRDICTIVEVVGPHGSHVRVRSSDIRPHVVIGLLRTSEAMFLAAMRRNPPGSSEDL
ncbi:MAG: hypothetical protein WBM00_11950 [Solirubrobacterales bacterium]